jgi:hypothetical protein
MGKMGSVPIYPLFYWAVVAATAKMGWIAAHDKFVLPLGYRVFADTEGIKACLFTIGIETAARDVDKLTSQNARLGGENRLSNKQGNNSK